jgi:hypothetical protein
MSLRLTYMNENRFERKEHRMQERRMRKDWRAG